ncbi:MAG: hypothetical protein ACJ75Q_06175 [Gaiellaceae bacterium]
MGIVNRRNAVLGWGIWKLSKPVLKSKAKSATPSVEGGRPNKSLVVATGAGVIGALAFWRKRRGDDEG